MNTPAADEIEHRISNNLQASQIQSTTPERMDSAGTEPQVDPLPILEDKFTSDPNEFGVYRVYHTGRPSYIPKEATVSNNCPNFISSPGSTSAPLPPDRSRPFVPQVEQRALHDESSFAPFKNKSTHMFANWVYESRNSLSNTNLDNLVREVITHPDFIPRDLEGFRAAEAFKVLDTWNETSQATLLPSEGWIKTSIPLRLPPAAKGVHPDEEFAPIYDVKGLLYRKPLQVIENAFSEASATAFHISPFEEYWTPFPGSPPERIYSELYNSDAFVEEDRKLKAQLKDDELEPVIAAAMLYSDSTHLTSFGTASMWPIYLYIGNLSKYTRGKPSSFSAHHLAYIPKV